MVCSHNLCRSNLTHLQGTLQYRGTLLTVTHQDECLQNQEISSTLYLTCGLVYDTKYVPNSNRIIHALLSYIPNKQADRRTDRQKYTYTPHILYTLTPTIYIGPLYYNTRFLTQQILFTNEPMFKNIVHMCVIRLSL